MTEQQIRDHMCSMGASLFNRGLTAGSSGNLSVRLENGLLITPTNSCIGDLAPARLSKIDRNGNLLSGDLPSKEVPIHLAMYAVRPDAGAVVHLHSTYSAAVSCLAGLAASNCLPPLTAYFVMKVGKVPLIPYHRPGDPALAPVIRSVAASNHALLLANHGPVVAGATLQNALYSIEELEETAKLFLLLHGREARPLSEAQIAELA